MADFNPTNAACKTKLRAAAMALRDAISPAERMAAAEAIGTEGLQVELKPGLVISAYAPIRSELSPLPLLRGCAAAGAKLALPVVVGRGQPLVMKEWRLGAPVKRGVWGITEPADDAAEVFPDIVIVPLLAFDRRGHRIGYGAGYYDMTIARLRTMKQVTAIGIALAAQEIPEVPATPRDARLDRVLTEREAIDCRA